jgi:copper chaperone CopZ
MRKLVLFSLALFGAAAFACSRQTESIPEGAAAEAQQKMEAAAPAEAPATPSAETLANAKTVALKLSGLHCPTCEKNVNTAVSAVDGVISCMADRNTGMAVVNYDATKTNPDALVAAVAGAPGMNGSPGQYSATVQGAQ